MKFCSPKTSITTEACSTATAYCKNVGCNMHKVELLGAQQAASWVHDITEHHICSLNSGSMLAIRPQDGVNCTYYIPMLWSVFFFAFFYLHSKMLALFSMGTTN